MAKMGHRGIERCPFQSITVCFEILDSSALGLGPRALLPLARLALNLEVLGRGLAAIGNLFVLHCLSFVQRGKTGFLNSGNMNKNVLASRIGLNKSEALGRVEPLHSTFS